ncbi:MAG: glycerate-2-kinase family protein, partial [Firmicutes bacterium]|nr:glycerate-2-kinase family protein [Bacillota bacterium]
MEWQKIKNAEQLLACGQADARAKVLELTDRVLAKLDQRVFLKNMIRRDGSKLCIGQQVYDLADYERVYAFTSGKAGNHMARAFEDILGDDLTQSVTIIKLRDEEDVYRKTEVFVGGHPLPNEEGIRGCRRMIELCEQMGPKDLLLVGLSGGCSALMGYPSKGLTLEDLQEATDVMLKAGMWVMDINDIRGHLSQTARGRLGQHVHGAKILCFELWDATGVAMDDYAKPVPIMGTPVGYDTVTFEDIRKIIHTYGIEEKLPPRVADYLLNYDPAEETPQSLPNDVDYYIVGTLPDSCKVAEEVAADMGVPCHVLTTYTEGESR